MHLAHLPSDHACDEVERLVARLRSSEPAPVLLGIDGPGGAGKSTFARHLVAQLGPGAVVVEGDDFYRDLPETTRIALDARQGVEEYFDWQRLRRQVLEPVRAGERVLRYQRYDWATASMGSWVELATPDVVVVEGVYTLRPELRDLLDVTVYVEADEATRRRRQLARGQNPSAWIERWMAAEDLYASDTAPRTVADVVVTTGCPAPCCQESADTPP